MEKHSEIKISVRNLVEFLLRSGDIDNRHGGSDKEAMQKGSRLHRKIQRQMGASYHAEMALVYVREYEDFSVRIEGRADGIIDEKDGFAIDEIKGVFLDLIFLEEPVPVHLAQAKCYAYIYATQHELEKMVVQMTYGQLETEEIKRFRQEYTYKELEIWFEALLADYYPWAQFQYTWRQQRNHSMEHLEFPFPYREGQRDIVSGVFHTIKEQKELFIQAPTGVGKTMSTIFPSVRAVGEGFAEKIFYLTAKTVTRTVAEEAFRILQEKGLDYKVLTLTAKEKMCACEEMECNPDHCPFAKGHYDRVNDAVYELLTTANTLDRSSMQQQAEKWKVCPFEMSLDLSTWVDAVICDYNYVFDPNVYLRRFFAEGVKGEYIFLIDEAHNLVDRGRSMYSAALYKEDVLAAKRLVKPHSRKLERYLEKVNKQMLAYKRECENYEILPSVGNLVLSLMSVLSEMEKFLEEFNDQEERKELLDFYFQVRNFLMIEELVDENYVIYSELERNGHFRVQLFCVNPAVNLQNCLDKGVAAVFFSATLLPIGYYRKLFSTNEKDYAIYAESPFERDNRCLLVGRDVSSKYTRRGYEEYLRMAKYIQQTVTVQKGNYMVFFPSHKLLQDVFEIYQAECESDEVDYCVQTQGMGEEAREIFLENFMENPERTMVGFCVMGGIFAEGIDLIGDKLIGALVVGTGIPQISNEREILQRFYDQKGENGFDYAYRYPGMNKVLQAAGRVIRTREDRGIILLLDERFLSWEYRQLFPREWSSYQVCSLWDVGQPLKEFWQSV
ncbi:MAG: ATP-dependent DNA helicase [Lachnospiraceae bacterium]|nr:ATP-dependent DNA helicase [Lachnospiraceae bacterium]